MKVKSKIDFFFLARESHNLRCDFSFLAQLWHFECAIDGATFPAPLYFSPVPSLSAATCNQKMIHISLFGFWLHCYFSHCAALEATNWQVAPWPHRPPLTLAVCVCVCWDFEKFMPLAL